MNEKKERIKDLPAILVTIMPYALVIMLLVLVPLIYVAVMSIMTRPSYGGVEFVVSFSGYKSLMDPVYLLALYNSCKMAFVSTAIILVVSYPIAFVLASVPKRVASKLIIIMMIPYYTNSMVRLYSFITLFNSKGIINNFLIQLGLIDKSMDFLYNDTMVIWGLVYICIPYAVLPMYSSIDRLSKSVLEASNDLGASPIQTFFRVTMPLTMPGVFAAAVISFIPSLGNYFVSDILGGSTSLMLGNLIKNQFSATRNWPFGSALSILLVILTLVLLALYNKVGDPDDLGGVM